MPSVGGAWPLQPDPNPVVVAKHCGGDAINAGIRASPGAADPYRHQAGFVVRLSLVLVLVPKGTVLPVIKRQGEWIQVRLSPELRKVGIPMRWYKNEDTGFVHDSTVEVIKGQPPAKPASQEPPASQPPREYVRVPARQSNTDIKASAGSGSIVLLLVPSGTVLPVLGRQGEWIQVRLSPELRQVGTPMRWYKNEEAGFVHDSTVEVFKK